MSIVDCGSLLAAEQGSFHTGSVEIFTTVVAGNGFEYLPETYGSQLAFQTIQQLDNTGLRFAGQLENQFQILLPLR